MRFWGKPMTGASHTVVCGRYEEDSEPPPPIPGPLRSHFSHLGPSMIEQPSPLRSHLSHLSHTGAQGGLRSHKSHIPHSDKGDVVVGGLRSHVSHLPTHAEAGTPRHGAPRPLHSMLRCARCSPLLCRGPMRFWP